jgi:tetratricopeptide (TPR) repeat protein
VARTKIESRPSASRAASSIPDSVARLGPWPAYQRALALSQAHRFAESLPYFRRALETPPTAWEPYRAYAISLFLTTHQVREHLGRPQPVTRSSWERVALMREAARQLDAAARLAGTPKDRAAVAVVQARHLGAWGLSWDALSDYNRAVRDDPAERESALLLAARMRSPVVGLAKEKDER